MAIIKGVITSGSSVIFGRNSIDNIVESVENSDTYVTSGGKLLANYMDLQSNVGGASTESEKAKAPTTGAIQNYVSSANVIPQASVNGLASSLDAKQDKVTAGYRLTFTGNTLDSDRYMPIETVDVSGTSPSVTVMAGHAYKIMATNKQVTINTETVGNDVFGLEGHAVIFVSGIGNIKLGQNIYFADALEPDSANNCTIRFHDGKAIISVEDRIAGHVVTVNAVSGTNTLNYWLSQPNTAGDDSTQYISFDASLDGQGINIGGATTYNAEKHVVGNGYTRTILTGSINCTAKTTFSDLGLNNVVVSLGTLTLGDVFIPSGSTVAVSGGTLAVEKVTGSGGTIELNGENIRTLNSASEVVFTGDTLTKNAHIAVTSGGAHLDSCTFTGIHTGLRVFYVQTNPVSGSVVLENCVFSNNTNQWNAKPIDIQIDSGALIVSNTVTEGAVRTAGTIHFLGSNFIGNVASTWDNGSFRIASGAIIDFTGNANTPPMIADGGIVMGSNVQIYPSSGSASAVSIGGGTYGGITNGGVLLGPVGISNGESIVGSTNTVINLGGPHIIISNGKSASISSVTITGGTCGGDTGRMGGAIQTLTNTLLDLTDVTISGNVDAGYGSGAGIHKMGFLNLTRCVVSGNGNGVEDIYLNGGTMTVLDSTVGGVVADGNVKVFLSSSNTINRIVAKSPGQPARTGTVTFTDGAILNLSGNTNDTPIAPGGGITIPAGAVVTIIGSNGPTYSAYLSELALTGSTITNTPAVLGATVTIPTSGGPYEVGFADGTSSAYIAGESERQEVLTGKAVVYVGEQ